MASVSAEAFFVSRGELLGWLNSALGLRLQKVEETANGAIACQLLDALHPGLVPLRRVDFNAASEYDAIANYKVLQDCLLKLGVDKPIDVARLVKGRPLDNTECMQWFRAYWGRRTGGSAYVEGYDGPGRRAGASKTGDLRGGRSVGGGGGGGGGNAGALPPAAPAASFAPKAAPAAARAAAPAQQPRRIAAAASVPPAANSGSSNANANGNAAATDGAPTAAAARLARQEAADAAARADAACRERDFYWGKLRAIEVLCGAPGASARHPALRTVEAILYAATAEAGEALLDGALAELESGASPEARAAAAAAAAAGAAAASAAGGGAEPRLPSPLAARGAMAIMASAAAATDGVGAGVMPAGSAELPPLAALQQQQQEEEEEGPGAPPLAAAAEAPAPLAV